MVKDCARSSTLAHHSRQDAEGKDVYRAYTPVSDDKQKGRVDFVIKIYPQVWGNVM